MPCTVLMGAQWGDEGKGKITDVLAGSADAVVRYQGGNNAGHTIEVGGTVFKLHIVPSGVVRGGKVSVIGDGCVVDPWVLEKELEALETKGIPTGKVLLSDRAQLIMPYHRSLDVMQEVLKGDGKKVGTTGRGIGPCYQDKAGRTGIRAGDLRYPDLLKERFGSGLRNAMTVAKANGLPIDVDGASTLKDLSRLSKLLLPHITDTPDLLNRMLEEGKEILLEGAQGTFLDIDRGTYPFVTSSSCTAGYASGGTGIGPLRIDRVVGVLKAYTTRVGGGPFPTELVEGLGDRIRERGREYGTTTARPRRCGWLDLVMVRTASMWNSMTDLAVTKVDVLSGIDPLKVCVSYDIPPEVAEIQGTGTELKYFPSHLEVLSKARPRYIEVRGWEDMTDAEWAEVKAPEDLPRRLRDYLSLIEKETRTRIGYLSFGPSRDRTLTIGRDAE